MLFAIRDDDTSYFTKPEELEQAYDFIKNGVISLSVVYNTVPYHKDTVYPYGKNIEKKFYLIDKNKKLIDYLKKKCERYDILLHGYSHEYKKINNKWLAEMRWKSEKELETELTLAKNELEKLFSKNIKVFVAPNNSINQNAVSVIEKLNLNYSGIIYHNDRKKNLKYWKNYIKRWTFRLIYKIQYPKILNYGKHKELVAYSLDNFERLKYEYNWCKKNGTPFVIYTHYWQLNIDNKKKELLKKIYNYVIEDGAKLVSLNKCFEKR